jgi:phage terminase small subunit
VPRPRSPNRDKAFEIFKEHNGNISNKEIARILNEKLVNINNWRTQDKWAKRLNKVGAPYGNQNAVGNSGGGAPKGNYNGFKYGKYTARIPFAVKTIMEELDIEDPIEKQWRSICLQEARIIHMQDIMHVDDRNDLTIDVKKVTGGKNPSIEYEIQYAWDKESNLINTLSRANATLTKMLKDYVEMVHANWDTATEEQKLRIEKMRAHIDEYKAKIEHNKKKLELEKERFEHQKSIDAKKFW